MDADEQMLQQRFGTPQAADPDSAMLAATFGVPARVAPTQRQAQDIGDSILAGLQDTGLGRLKRGGEPDIVLGEDAPWYHRQAAAAGALAGDILPMIAGGVAGAVTARSPMGVAAGVMAMPMALREGVIKAQSYNHAASWADAWEIAKASAIGGTKGAAIGLATAGAGRIVAPLLAPLGKVVGGTATFATELAALTTTAAAVEGHIPTWRSFMDNAILLGGIKGAVKIAQGLRSAYVETGKLPSEVLNDASRPYTLPEHLKLGNFAIISAEKKGLSATENALRTANLKLELEKAGYKPVAAKGNYEGVSENSFFVPEIKPGKAHAFGQKYQQDSVLTHSGLIEAGGKVRPITGDAVFSPEHTKDFTQIGGEKFQLPIDFEKNIPLMDIMRPARRDAVLEALRKGELPEQYKQLAIEERIKAAFNADNRPALVQQLLELEKDPKAALLKDPVRYEYVVDKATAEGLIRAVADVYSADVLAQRRGVVPVKAAVERAHGLIERGEVRPHKIGAAANDAEIAARAMLVRGAAERAKRLGTVMAEKKPEQIMLEDKLNMAAALEQVGLFYGELAGVGAEAGRALHMLRAIKQNPDRLGDAESLMKIYGNSKGDFSKIAELIKAIKDPDAMRTFAETYNKATTFEMVLEGWKASILSGIHTTGANMLGNILRYAVQIPSSMIQATVEAGSLAIKGTPMPLSLYKAKALSPLYGLMLGARDSLTVAAEVWKQKGEHVEKADVYKQAIPGKTGDVVRLPFRWLQVQDVLFRTWGERAKAHELAVERAGREGFSPGSVEFDNAVKRYVDKPQLGLTDAAAQQVTKAIELEGAKYVFGERLGPRMETLSRAVQGSPAEFIFPFRRTPVNLVSWAVQHIPGMNLMSARWREDFAAGGEARARAITRVVIGTGIAMGAYSLAEQGVLTGGGLFEKEMNRTKAGAQIPKYSLLIKGEYYNIERLEPVSKILMLSADLYEMQEAATDKEDKAKIGAMAVLAFANTTISTTYMSGLSNAMHAATDPDRYLDSFIEQYAASLVPKIIGQTVAIDDPYKREVDGALEAIQSQLPWLREKLLPVRDVWGEKVGNEKLFSVLPIATTTASQDKVKTEAVRLSIAIADAPKDVTEAGPFSAGFRKIPLTDVQRDIYRQVRGKEAMAILAPLVNSPDWDAVDAAGRPLWPDYAKADTFRGALQDMAARTRTEALEPNAVERQKMREKIVNEIIRESTQPRSGVK
jgi:hypothetical protein